MFIVYINDLESLHLLNGTSLLTFADDILIYKPVSSHSDFLDFQNYVNLISLWTKLNHLTLNPVKSKYMLISHLKRADCFPPLQLNGICLEQVRYYKYLGIWISDDLSWEKHIQLTCNKARRHLGYIYRTFSPYCSSVSLLNLYRSQVLPILEYGCVVWDPHLIEHKTRLENAQLFATRIASKQWTQSSEHLNSHFNIPSLSSRRTYYKLLFFYKFSEGYTYCPQGLLIPNTNPNSRVAHNKQFIQPFARTTSFLILILLVLSGFGIVNLLLLLIVVLFLCLKMLSEQNFTSINFLMFSVCNFSFEFLWH